MIVCVTDGKTFCREIVEMVEFPDNQECVRVTDTDGNENVVYRTEIIVLTDEEAKSIDNENLEATIIKSRGR